MRTASLSLLAFATVAAAQTPAYISPVAAASGLGNSNNNIPFSWMPTAYQQVHSLESFNNQAAATITQMRLRMGSGFTNFSGNSIDVELWMGDCPNSAETASGVFASNVVFGTEVNVLPRQMVSLPTVPNNDWAVAPFPFSSPYSFTGQTHVSWRAIVWGNGNNNQLFTYPLDAWWHLGTSVNNGPSSGCQSATGTAAATHNASIFGPGRTSTFRGNSYVVAGGLPAVLSIGASATSWFGVPLPFDLTVFGGTGCFVRNSVDLTQVGATTPGQNGAVSLTMTLPNNPFLTGATFYSQYLFLEGTANPLGIFTTNGLTNVVGRHHHLTRIYASGNPTASSGTLDISFGMSIGLN